MATTDRPNIVYLHCHDAGRYVQPYGHAVPTPNIQRFAEQGVLFRKAFTTAPTCSPSRAALLTGQYAHNAGMLGLAHRGFSLKEPRQHLAHVLRAAGYATALCGVQHEATADLAAGGGTGYDSVLAANGQGEAPTVAAVNFLHQKHDRPFFLSVGYFAPHRGKVAHRPPLSFPAFGPPADERYVMPPVPLPDTPATRRDMAEYIASMQSTDLGFGKALEALDRAGLADNTVVIMTTDHGIAFPGMKCRLTDHGTGVMLILRGPAGGPYRGGKVIDAAVTHLDLFPSLCELLGLDKPDWLQGKSLTPLVAGEADTLHDATFGEVTYHAAYEPMRSIRTDRWKFIRRFDDRVTPVLPNCDDSLSKTVLYESGWAEKPQASRMLFDLALDPTESQNLASDLSRTPLLEDLERQLWDWMRATHDPLCDGPVPAPEGAIVSPQEGYSPGDR